MRFLLPVALLGVVVLAPGRAAAEGLTTDDPTLRPYQERTESYLKRCRNDLSHVEKSSCYADQVAALRIRVNSELKKRMAEAEAEAADGEIGGLTGAERAKKLKAGLKRTQSAWDAYVNADCGFALEEVSMGGGNGGDLEMVTCQIRQFVARYNELRR
ncbi:lysozyme inhibitor LprI family protein [Methylobacterium sp. E-045]|uniref:lysozyme inhibitor LprI family protein n=1 Tax=Methylobacterium sp. E-045 TaxID=2836575 RepID=UPI001FB8A329|nr:lysozyme inhibitor LprI family protein [Methylobacterium sp. E-045]MCJ2131571.1 lysozyme inhibitor LprI family protein [Methylobacterium sp. E-045]